MKESNLNIRVGKEEKQAYVNACNEKNFRNLSEFVLAVLRKFYKRVEKREFKD